MEQGSELQDPATMNQSLSHKPHKRIIPNNYSLVFILSNYLCVNQKLYHKLHSQEAHHNLTLLSLCLFLIPHCLCPELVAIIGKFVCKLIPFIQSLDIFILNFGFKSSS